MAAVLGKTLTVQGRDASTMAEAARILAEKSGARVVSVPLDAVAPEGAPPALARSLSQVFRYYQRPEAFASEELWRLLGEPQFRFDAFEA